MNKILPMIGAALAILVSAGAASAQPDPNQVYIQSLSYGGTGCPAGTVGQSIADDRQSFTLIFDQFIATLGPGVPITDSRKNCQLNVNLHLPNGFQFSIGTVDYRGYVQLNAGVSAEQRAVYYFAGNPAQATSTNTFLGPVAKDYLSHDVLPFSTVVWSPCGAVVPVNINDQVRLFGTGQGMITTDSVDGKVRQVFGLRFRPC